MRSIPVFSPDSPAYALSQEVLQQFIEWRHATPRGFRRIPEKLWNSATKLAASATVFQVSRFLGLDYSHLKKRVVALCGPNCPALPGRRQGNSTSPQATLPNSDSPKGNSAKTTRPMNKPHSPCTGRLNTSIEEVHHPAVTLTSAISQFPQDGFLEATVAPIQPWIGPPVLAEIRSPNGALMRLFSLDTVPIIQTFLQS